MSLFGGLAAAGLGGSALSHAEERGPVPPTVAPGDLDATTKAGLDKVDADFNQVVIRERVIRRRGPYGRPVVRERIILRRRPRAYYGHRRGPIVRRRVIVR
ncbi:MAG: hypothetical protein B7Z40_05630 [Bosea sp. 12-68-7]|nr:MAG: hypothetical protein B7Z40_05630 [Bosea sp. 12-68-7]OYW98662.1 MAG: hypothetical protein B7Z14_14205 [Bosea sp. 32-68-6]